MTTALESTSPYNPLPCCAGPDLMLLCCGAVVAVSCRIADGPVRVELQRTLLTNVPGVSFGVKADAFSNEDDKPVKGEPKQPDPSG